MTSSSRMPTLKERENNKRRERRRRAIAAKIFSGLRQFGNYKLPKHCDNNEVLKALCSEAGWTVEEDGTTYRKGVKPSERVEAYGSRPGSPTSSFAGVSDGASLIPWLKGLSAGLSSGANGSSGAPSMCAMHGSSSSAPITPPLSSPRPNKMFVKPEWDTIREGQAVLGTNSAFHFHTTSSPNVLQHGAQLISYEHVDGCRTPCSEVGCITPTSGYITPTSGCLTPTSDVGDSEQPELEFWNRYNESSGTRWINGMRVCNSNGSLALAGPKGESNFGPFPVPCSELMPETVSGIWWPGRTQCSPCSSVCGVVKNRQDPMAMMKSSRNSEQVDHVPMDSDLELSSSEPRDSAQIADCSLQRKENLELTLATPACSM